jgi:Na+(H+)/acetate symporter ActP
LKSTRNAQHETQILENASTLTEDLGRIIIHPGASEKDRVWVSRETAIGVAILA